MKLVLRITDCRGGTSVIRSSDPFPEIICLDKPTGLAEVIAAPFPVHLIEVIRQQSCSGDDPLSWSSFHHHFNMTKQKIEPTPDVGGVIAVDERENGTVLAIISNCLALGLDPIGRCGGLLSEIDRVSVCCQTWNGRTRGWNE